MIKIPGLCCEDRVEVSYDPWCQAFRLYFMDPLEGAGGSSNPSLASMANNTPLPMGSTLALNGVHGKLQLILDFASGLVPILERCSKGQPVVQVLGAGSRQPSSFELELAILGKPRLIQNEAPPGLGQQTPYRTTYTAPTIAHTCSGCGGCFSVSQHELDMGLHTCGRKQGCHRSAKQKGAHQAERELIHEEHRWRRRLLDELVAAPAWQWQYLVNWCTGSSASGGFLNGLLRCPHSKVPSLTFDTELCPRQVWRDLLDLWRGDQPLDPGVKECRGVFYEDSKRHARAERSRRSGYNSPSRFNPYDSHLRSQRRNLGGPPMANPPPATVAGNPGAGAAPGGARGADELELEGAIVDPTKPLNLERMAWLTAYRYKGQAAVKDWHRKNVDPKRLFHGEAEQALLTRAFAPLGINVTWERVPKKRVPSHLHMSVFPYAGQRVRLDTETEEKALVLKLSWAGPILKKPATPESAMFPGELENSGCCSSPVIWEDGLHEATCT
jgi:hypothetical protein